MITADADSIPQLLLQPSENVAQNIRRSDEWDRKYGGMLEALLQEEGSMPRMNWHGTHRIYTIQSPPQ